MEGVTLLEYHQEIAASGGSCCGETTCGMQVDIFADNVAVSRSIVGCGTGFNFHVPEGADVEVIATPLGPGGKPSGPMTKSFVASPGVEMDSPIGSLKLVGKTHLS